MVKSFLPSVPDQECAVHLLGPFDTFEFSDEEFILNMEALLVRYADETNWRRVTQEGEDDE
jgi:hypothetical protein